MHILIIYGYTSIVYILEEFKWLFLYELYKKLFLFIITIIDLKYEILPYKRKYFYL